MSWCVFNSLSEEERGGWAFLDGEKGDTPVPWASKRGLQGVGKAEPLLANYENDWLMLELCL